MLYDIQKKRFCAFTGLTKNDLMANSFIFFTAGYETTASALQFFLYNMAVNPHIQDKVTLKIQMLVRIQV